MDDDSKSRYTDEGVRTFMTAVVMVIAKLDQIHPEVDLVQDVTALLRALAPKASERFPQLLLEDEDTVQRLSNTFVATMTQVRQDLDQQEAKREYPY